MTAIAIAPDRTAEAVPTSAPNDGAATDLLPALNAIRLIAARARCAARLDLTKACALLSMEKDAAAEAHAEALTRTLRQALGRAPVFFAPGVADLSFDERWLLRLLDRARAGDDSSLAFLILRRADPAYRNALGFLARGVARGVDTL